MSAENASSLDDVRLRMQARRMTARDLVTVAYYRAFQKPVPAGVLFRLTRQLEGKPDEQGRLITDLIPRYITDLLEEKTGEEGK